MIRQALLEQLDREPGGDQGSNHVFAQYKPQLVAIELLIAG
jgi:hypothetical protein